MTEEEMSNKNIQITVGQHRETLKWHGLMYRNVPTPSGCDRWLLKISDDRGFDDKENALTEFRKSLLLV